jgi:rhodanese-related sulfurtransferase
MIKKYFTSIFLSLLVFMSVSCNSQTLRSIPPKEFSEQIKKENVILLDVRTPEEYAEGHLTGAILINYHDDNFVEQVSKLDKNKTVYVYCRSGSRSGNAQEIMLKQDFKSVINLNGGILAWEKAGLPVEN